MTDHQAVDLTPARVRRSPDGQRIAALLNFPDGGPHWVITSVPTTLGHVHLELADDGGVADWTELSPVTVEANDR